MQKLLDTEHFVGPHDEFSAAEARQIADRGEEHLARILAEPVVLPERRPRSGGRAAVVVIAAVVVVLGTSWWHHQSAAPTHPSPPALSWSTGGDSETVADTRMRLEHLAQAASGRAAGATTSEQVTTQSWPGPTGSGEDSTVVTTISIQGDTTRLLSQLAGRVRSDGMLSLSDLSAARVLRQQTIRSRSASGLFSQHPVTASALAAQLIGAAGGCASSRAECLVEGIARTDVHVLESPPRMAAILRVLAAEPGVTNLGVTTDRLGRKVEGFAALTARGDETVLLVSPSGAYLGSETLRRDGGATTVTAFTAVRP